MYKKRYFFLYILTTSWTIAAPSLLSQLNDFCAQFPRTLFAEHIDQHDLNYAPFYRERTTSYISFLLQKVGLAQPQLLSAEYLQKQLNQILDKRLDHQLEQKPIGTLRTLKNTQLFIWADLHANLHSLVAALNFLAQEKIINEDLRIIKEDKYLIFTGDSISYSAYSLETLSLIILLMQKNPQHCLYIKGYEESYTHWKNHELKQQLQVQAQRLSRESIPLSYLVDTFFEILPEILFVYAPESDTERIAFYFPGWSMSNNPLFGAMISSLPAGFSQHSIVFAENAPNKTEVILHTQDWKRYPKPPQLYMTEQAFGVTCWTLLNSSAAQYINAQQKTADTFGIIQLNSSIDKSVIALYTQSATDKNFNVTAQYNIFTGQAIDQKLIPVKKPVFQISSTMSLLQGVPAMGIAAKKGLNAAINRQNEKGGIDGKHISLDIRNDNYTPHITRTLINKLLNKYHIDIMIAPIGSPTLSSYLDLINQEKLLVLFPITGGPQFQKADLHGLIHLCGSYADEVTALMEFVIQNYSSRNFAFFYQNDSYGLGPLKAAQAVLKKNNITTWLELPYSRGTVHFGDLVQKIKEHQVDALGFFSTSAAAQEFIRQLDIETLSNETLFGISFLADASFRHFIKKSGLPIILGSRVPNPAQSNLPIVQEYRAQMDTTQSPYDTFSLEAYIAGRLLTQSLEDLSKHNKPFTRQNIQNYFESVNNFNFEGLLLHFNPERRSLAKYIWLETETDVDWIQKEIVYEDAV